MIQPFLSVGLPGFEPGKTEPKPVVLPLHHSPIIKCFLLKSGAKVVQSCELTKKNAKKLSFLCKKRGSGVRSSGVSPLRPVENLF